MKKISDKKRELDKEYSLLRKSFLEKYPGCRANLPGCTMRATEVHHSAGRGQYYLDIETWVAICRTCHNYLESHPREAKLLNLSKDRL